MQQKRGYISRLLRIAIFMLAVTPASAQIELPSGRFSFEGFSMGILVGFMKGNGILVFQGAEYPFKVRSLSLFDLGGSSVRANGVVYNMVDVADFEGNYGGGAFGTTTIQGGRSAVIQNGNGVRLQFDTLQRGLELNLGGGGFRIEFEQPIELESASMEDRAMKTGSRP